MAKLKVIGSSSKGNGYMIECTDGILLIEVGTPVKELIPLADWSQSPDIAAITTHAHLDHAKYIPQYLAHGIPVYSTSECAHKYSGVGILQHRRKYRLGGFTVMPLTVPHNAECYAYVIKHDEIGTLLFATDLTNFPYNVKCDHLMIECNYSEELIINSLVNGAEIRSQSQNHLELNECIETIQRLNKGQINTLVLLHLSDGLSDEKMFYDKIYLETGLKPIVANHGVEVELIKDEF
jgi:phosphoribosyl 1,2-cyclic phosphodiesterase